MSTKIYNANLWLGDPESLMGFLNATRSIFIEEGVKHIKGWGDEKLKEYTKVFHTDLDSTHFNLYNLLRKEIKKGEDTPFNFQASVVVYFHKGKICIIPFGINIFPELKKSFDQNPKIKFYGYWDNTDQDEDCSEEEWSERRSFFDGFFDEFTSFDSMGLCYDLSNNESLFRIVYQYYHPEEVG